MEEERMSESPARSGTEPQVTTCGILPRGSEPRVLLVPEGNGWTLPHVTSAEPFGSRADLLNRTFHDLLGADVTVLRRLGGEPGPEVYALESHGPAWEPPVGRWIGRAQLEQLLLAVPAHRTLLENWFAERESGEVPPLRNAWERPGWYAEASDWIEKQAVRHGMAPVGPVEQRRTWSISCLLRVPTTAGSLFFKALPPFFAHEPALTEALSTLYPGRVPHVLAVDQQRGWMLMREFHGRRLVEVPDLAAWEKAMRLVARIQVDLAGQTDRLFALGFQDRRLDRLAAQIDPLLTDTAALMPAEAPLLPAEIDRLLSLAPRLKALCDELAAGPVPPSLVHGDLHAGNIAVVDAEALIYDWTDGCVSHPFLDLITLIPNEGPLSTPDTRARLRDAYLEAWNEYAPMADLRRPFQQAQILGGLHQAVSYQMITANIEAKAEMAAGVPDSLRMLLSALAEMEEGA